LHTRFFQSAQRLQKNRRQPRGARTPPREPRDRQQIRFIKKRITGGRMGIGMKKAISITLAAALALTLFVGCQSGGKTKSGYASQISFYQWTEYTPKSVLDGFKKKYGITVKMTNFSSSEQMIAKLKAGGLSQYDVTVPSCYTAKAMIAQNLIEKFDKSAVPNLKNIDPSCLDKDFDKGNQYTVPYMLSPCVLVVNTKKVKTDIKSFNDLLNPSLKNKIVVVDDERPIMGLALKALGFSVNDTKASDLAKASTWLSSFKPNVKVFDSDSPKTSLISGDCTVGYIYNGEASLALQANKDLKVVWTKEGLSGLIMDNLSLVKGTKHKTEAELFINYILGTQASRMITAAYPYTNPNKAAHMLLGKAYLNNAAINISWDKIKSAELIDDVGNTLTKYDDVWSNFKT
jgi:spermidine/putrescine-binding protein